MYYTYELPKPLNADGPGKKLRLLSVLVGGGSYVRPLGRLISSKLLIQSTPNHLKATVFLIDKHLAYS